MEKTKGYFFGKLGKRLFLFSGTIIFVSLIIMIIQGVHCSHRAVKNAADEYLQSIIECKQEHFDLWIKERIADIKMLSKLDCLISCQTDNKTLFCNAIYTTKKRSKAYKAIAVYDLNKKQVFSLNKTHLNLKILNQPLYKGIYLSYEKIPQITIACFAQNKFIILAKLDLTDVLEEIIHHEIGPRESGRILVLGPKGRVLASSKKQNFKVQKIIQQSTLVDPFGIKITAQIPWNEAMKELFLYIKFAVSTACLTLLCMFLLAWKMSKNISEPILKISSAARHIAKGDLEQRVNYQGKDEIGTLIEDFNTMAGKLSSNQNAMEKKHQQLQLAYNKIEKTQLQLAQIETLAATGKMAASIVHEIRNPLSTIKMNLQILTRKLQQEPRYQEHGNIALTQINHLENMLNGLLDFSRPISLKKRKVKLKDILEFAIEMISGELSSQDIKIDCQTTPCVIECDLDRMQHTIANILLNAIFASEAKQKIEIKNVVVNDKVNIQIIDNGKGIAAENIENIFEPFFSLREGGTGLGLSYVKKIVQLHGGNIEVKSELGKGSCFIVLLPTCDS